MAVSYNENDGVLHNLVRDLRKKHSAKPKTTMTQRASPSKIMLPIIKQAGLK